MKFLDLEYELFKSLCNKRPVVANSKNKQLIKSILSKGASINQAASNYTFKENINALSEELIRKNFDSDINTLIDPLNISYETKSTNKKIAEQRKMSDYSVLLTEYQSSGQGRREKKWLSPLAENIYLSIEFTLQTAYAHFLPLVTAVAICRVLKQVGIINCQIKWPNDIYLDGKKLAGILLESRYNAGTTSFVVGIGLNVNMQNNKDIDQLWTSLRISQNRVFDRNILISLLLSELIATYNRMPKFKVEQFILEWQTLDCLLGEEVLINDGKKIYSAIANGLADDGALLILQSAEQDLEKIYSADVSIKKL